MRLPESRHLFSYSKHTLFGLQCWLGHLAMMVAFVLRLVRKGRSGLGRDHNRRVAPYIATRHQLNLSSSPTKDIPEKKTESIKNFHKHNEKTFRANHWISLQYVISNKYYHASLYPIQDHIKSNDIVTNFNDIRWNLSKNKDQRDKSK